MLLRNTLLYLPAQIVGPMAQLVAMIVWTHVVDEPTLGVITLVTATHELLQIGLLSWWSQYALRFLERYREDHDAARFYRTENAVLLASVIVQSMVIVAVLFVVIAPEADARLVTTTIAYVVTRTLNLYLGERARVRHQIGVYSIQVMCGPALGFAIGLVLIDLFGKSASWPLAGYAVAQLIAVIVVLPRIGCGRGLWPLDREIVNHALRYGIPLIIGGSLSWVGLNAARFVVNEAQGVGAAGLFAVGYGLGQRAAVSAAMLVTAAAYPIAVSSMERHGSKVAMRQLADNCALLIAILTPCVTGIFILRAEIVHLLIAPAFQTVTLAILPLSMLAGSIRSLRAYFADQTFLLHSRTELMAVIASIDAGVTVVLSIAFIHYWGLSGAAAATVIAALVAAVASFAIAFSRFGLTLPVEHFLPLATASAVMAAALKILPEASSLLMLFCHIATGSAIYVAVLSAFYASSLLKMLRPLPQQSTPDASG